MTDERLHEVLAEYLQAEDAGRKPDRREVIAAHPEFAVELEAFFANQDEFDSRAESLGPIPSFSRSRDAEPFWKSPTDSSTVGKPGGSDMGQFGDYELLEEIGRGGMGVVYRARHVALGRVVGLKMILRGPLASAADLERFRLEAQASAMLDHPNLVPIYEVGECAGQPYYTMKLVEGRSLADRLDEWKSEPRAAAQLVATLARAVHYAHQRGVLHRDLKPANILLEARASRERSGTPEFQSSTTHSPGGLPSSLDAQPPRATSDPQPFITDFGLAKCLALQNDLTQTGAVLGTPSYIAPEQAAGSNHALTTGADVYSLGAILYAMITGRPPFRAETPVETLRQVAEQDPFPPSRINRQLDRNLETICMKCLEKDPRHRYGSAEALADDIDRWLGHRPIRARRASPLEHALKWARRKPTAAALAAVSVVAIAILVAGTLWSNKRLQAEIKKVAEEHAQAQANFDRSEEHRLQSVERERIGRRHLYAAHVNLAQQAWESGQPGRMRLLLDGQRPAPNSEDLRGFEWYYFWRLGLQGLRSTLGTDHSAHRVRFARDGTSVFLGGEDGKIRDIDIASGDPRTEWQAHEGSIRALELTQDGQAIASIGTDNRVRVWDLDSKHERWEAQCNGVGALAISADGTRLAVVRRQDIVVFDSVAGQELAKLSGASVPASALAFSPDGRHIASVSTERPVRLWDIASGRQVAALAGHRVYVVAVAFSPDGTRVVSADEGGKVISWRLWDPWDPTSLTPPRIVQRHRGTVDDMCFSPDGSRLATAGEDGLVCVSDSDLQHESVFGHSRPVRSVAFSPASNLLLSGGADGTVRFWDSSVVDERVGSVRIGRHANVVYGVSFSRGGTELASCSQDQAIKRWDLPSGRELRPLLGHSGSVVSVAYSPREDVIASANSKSGNPTSDAEGGSIRLWDASSGKALRRYKVHPEAAWGIAFSPDGRSIASTGYTDKTVKLTDVATGEALRTLGGHPERLFCVAFAPDGGTVAAGGYSPNDTSVAATLWNTDTGQIQCRLRVRWVWCIAISPDGKTVATGSDGGIVKLWDVASGEELLQLRGHTTTVKAVAFSPDGRTFASGSADQTIKLWDAVTGEERATLAGHSDWVSTLSFSPDSRTLASGDWSGEVRLWQAAKHDGEMSP